MAEKSSSVGDALTSTTYPRNYFFYGSLMDPTQLSSVLRLDKQPSLLPGTLTGYRLMLWGPYPALVPEEGAIVPGLVYEVPISEDAQRLQHYETDNYAPQSCQIKLEDGTWKDGEIFVWAGSKGDLEEGVFDLKAWQAGNARVKKAQAKEEQIERMMALKARKHSTMAKKFQSGGVLPPLPPGTKTLSQRFPRWHFVYGSLMDPEILTRVLELAEKPELRKAQILGYRIKLWGQHPALVCVPGQVAEGTVYEIQSSQDARKLEKHNSEVFQNTESNPSTPGCPSYAPENFKTGLCQLRLDDGIEVIGSTLEWIGDESGLRDP